MSSTNKCTCSTGTRDGQPESRGTECIHRGTTTSLCIACYEIQKEVRVIQRSLDSISKQLTNQQTTAAREVEERIRQVYDGVFKDVNTFRYNINSLGNQFAADTKYKTWIPLTPFCKQIIDQPLQTQVLRASQSVDLVDIKPTAAQSPTGKRYVPVAARFRQSYSPSRTKTSSGQQQGDDGATLKTRPFSPQR